MQIVILSVIGLFFLIVILLIKDDFKHGKKRECLKDLTESVLRMILDLNNHDGIQCLYLESFSLKKKTGKFFLFTIDDDFKVAYDEIRKEYDEFILHYTYVKSSENYLNVLLKDPNLDLKTKALILKFLIEDFNNFIKYKENLLILLNNISGCDPGIAKQEGA